MTSPAGIPSYVQAASLPRECGPVAIPSDYEDENGHMNIRHYLDLEAQAIAAVFDRMGITDDYRASRGQGFFTAEHHIRYYAEVHVGDRVSVHARIVERSGKVVHAMAFLVDDTTERLASTLEVTATHVDLTSRRVVPFADDVADAVDRELARIDVDRPAPVCGAMGIRTRA
ncbi:acyl-CoA thioester hydrolase [Rhodococcus percolatus]|uniref:thioesterase family protein n=1 Tax=Rhodococcus opacus TaxID=37919 RepID=UPI0015FABB5E|nr:thioesterase family protein [Rhodococcus opacus]MBA8961905.1 acyl-CoA thioester hydrolase [Rhodococcus opacus]MBP2209567.1 acyl-CoA thioester hydrolase [Rhodococcus opacus]